MASGGVIFSTYYQQNEWNGVNQPIGAGITGVVRHIHGRRWDHRSMWGSEGWEDIKIVRRNQQQPKCQRQIYFVKRQWGGVFRLLELSLP